MKYIDSEKLKAEIERLIKVNKELTPRDFTQGIAAGYADVLSSIESLEQEQPTIKGWVARDMPLIGKNTGKLHFFVTKPKRKEGYWGGEFHSVYGLDMFFKDVSFADEPIEVELTIRKV